MDSGAAKGERKNPNSMQLACLLPTDDLHSLANARRTTTGSFAITVR